MNTAFSYDCTSRFMHPCVFEASRFTGKERDAESGLDNFGARYYASSMGRFMSPDWSDESDPVPYAEFGNPQSLNLYSYVNNNPLRSTDPDGHMHEECNTSSSSAMGSDGVLRLTVSTHCSIVPDWYNHPLWFHNWAHNSGNAVSSWAQQHPTFMQIMGSCPQGQTGCIQSDVIPWGPTGGLGSASITELKAMLGAEQTKLLGQLLGNSLKGAEKALENPSVPQGLTRQSLEIYKEIAQRVVAKGENAPGYATQMAWLKVIEKAIEMVGK